MVFEADTHPVDGQAATCTFERQWRKKFESKNLRWKATKTGEKIRDQTVMKLQQLRTAKEAGAGQDHPGETAGVLPIW